MEITGKIIAVLPARNGVSARGEWKAQSFVIETHDQYPKKMVFDVFGADRLAQFNIQTGEEMTVSFDIDAHEYQGRWFNTIRAWSVQKIMQSQIQPQQTQTQQGYQQPVQQSVQTPFPPQQPQGGVSGDGIPF